MQTDMAELIPQIQLQKSLYLDVSRSSAVQGILKYTLIL